MFIRDKLEKIIKTLLFFFTSVLKHLSFCILPTGFSILVLLRVLFYYLCGRNVRWIKDSPTVSTLLLVYYVHRVKFNMQFWFISANIFVASNGKKTENKHNVGEEPKLSAFLKRSMRFSKWRVLHIHMSTQIARH